MIALCRCHYVGEGPKLMMRELEVQPHCTHVYVKCNKICLYYLCFACVWKLLFGLLMYFDHSVFRTPSERLLLSKSYFLQLFTDFVSSCCWKLQVVNLYYQREQFTLSYEIQLVFNICPSFLFISFFLSFFITFIYLLFTHLS